MPTSTTSLTRRPCSPVIFGGVESKKYILEAEVRGCAFIEYDNDGWMDIFLLSGTRLEGGARVIVYYGSKKQAQAVVSQSSYYSCNDSRLHFGLGSVPSADVEVFWPSGLHETHKNTPGNQLITLRKVAGLVPNQGWSRE